VPETGLSGRLPPLWLAALFGIALAPRLALAVFFPETSGDSSVYLAVAENIRRNGCVSLSDPASAACAPDWGGNHAPGYPLFLAAVRLVFGGNPVAAGATAALILALAVTYATAALARLVNDHRWALAGGLLAALSPLTVPWSRFVLTEALASAIWLWLFAELMRAFARRRLQILPLALAGTAAAFVRLDSVTLVVPVVMTAFFVHSPAAALRRCLVLGLLVALPLGLWWYRSVAAGLDPVPNLVRVPTGWPQPAGYLDWNHTWLVSQYQYPGADYPLREGRYDRLSVPATAFRSESEREQVEALLTELAGHSGRPFPAHIDEAFADLAAAKRAAEPLRQRLLLPLRRAAVLWVNPFDSAGWPVKLGGAARDADPLTTALRHPLTAVVKAGTGVYRVALVVAIMGLVAWCALRRRAVPAVLALVAAHALTRSVVLAELVLIEPRYVVPLVPWLELALVPAALALWPRAQSSGVSAPMR